MKIKNGWLILIFLALSLTFLTGGGRRPSRVIPCPERIKIGILVKVPRVKVGFSGSLEIKDGETGYATPPEYFQSVWEVKPLPGGIQIGEKKMETSVLDITSSSYLKVNEREYRGKIKIIRESGQALTVINELGIEEYLYGVIREEISPAWPLEAVKAQAVAARTFALNQLGRHEEAGFDLCATTHCQVYGGASSEDPRSLAAVDKTQGEVLTYRGKLIYAPYHATCGGSTEDVTRVWSDLKRLPYLKGTRDGFCRDSPHYRWSARLSLREIEGALKIFGFKTGRIVSIAPLKQSRAGRISRLKINHSRGVLKVSANAFRLAVGPSLVRSTVFRMEKEGSGYLKFRGKGWGHGVGLCQWGARGMALKGYDYKEILRHFYPKTKINKIAK